MSNPKPRERAMTDEYNGQPIFYGCTICRGTRGRAQRSPHSLTCLYDKCKRELTKRNQEADAGPASDEFPGTGPMYCYKVKEVLGVSLNLLSTMSDYQKRAGRKATDEDIGVQVRGGFGEDESDGLMPGTRWVTLHELVDNIDEAGLAELDTFATNLKKVIGKQTRKRIRERETEDDED